MKRRRLLWSDKTSEAPRRPSRRLLSSRPVPPLTSCCNKRQRQAARLGRRTQRRCHNSDVVYRQVDALCCCCWGCTGETWRLTHTSLPPCKSLRSRRRRIRKTNSATSSPQHRQAAQAVSAANAAAAKNLRLKNVHVGARSADSAEFMNHSVTRREHRQSTCVS